MKRLVPLLLLTVFSTCAQTNVSGGGSNGPITPPNLPKQIGASYYPVSYGAKFDGRVVTDAVNATNGVITSASANFPTNAVVGQDAFVLSSTGTTLTTGAGSVNGVCQIQSIDSTTQITLNCNTVTPASSRTLFWGSNDDPAWVLVDAAVNSSGVCTSTVVIPAGYSRVKSSHLNGLPAGCIVLDGSIGATALYGAGVKSSVLVIGPDYDFTSQWGGNNFLPRDFQLNAFGLTTANVNGKLIIQTGSSGTANNIAVNQLNGTSTYSAASFSSSGGGCIQCFFDKNTNGVIGVNNSPIPIIQTFSGSSVSMTGTGALVSEQNTWGQTTGPGINCNSSGGLFSTQDTFFNVSGIAVAIEISSANCNAYLAQDNFTALSGGTDSVFYNAAGTVHARDTRFGGGTTNGAIHGAQATSIFDDQGGNNFASGSTNPLIGFTSGIWTGAGAGNTIYTACTGTATSSATLSMKISGSSTNGTAVANTCTSTTIDAGKPMSRAGHISGLIVTAGTGGVNASSGVFTVLQNGSTTTFTCTTGTATTCRDVAHAPVVTAVGDLISIQFTTQGSETLANVKATIIETN